jgi:hypothetical protein
VVKWISRYTEEKYMISPSTLNEQVVQSRLDSWL